MTRAESHKIGAMSASPPPTPRVFNIPASVPFMPALSRALADGTLVEGLSARDPLSLAEATLYLPTRRACRLAREQFLQVLEADAALLPRIVAIGDIDEDEIVFAQAAAGALAAEALDLPDALGSLERRLLLARLILRWAEAIDPHEPGQAPLVAHSPAAALRLSDDLARLIDDMTTRQVPWTALDGMVPGEVDQYWQYTLKFLQVASPHWPALLAERGRIDPAARRDVLIAAETERLKTSAGPVIAAGSTGSMPATASLLATIARLPRGALVLPGLDTDLDSASWDLIQGVRGRDGRDVSPPATGHPQFALEALLRRIGITREAVIALAPPQPHGREKLISEALRPAAATEHWHDRLAEPDFNTHVEAALASVTVIAAAHPEEEALTIAIALREALETPNKTAALVTPDRPLARRVQAALARWNVQVDDSGGDALADMPAGVFARLAGEAALGGLEPVKLLALLKHKLFRLGADDHGHAGAVATLECAILRGPRPKPGTAGLAHALATLRAELAKLRRNERSDIHRADPRARLADDELAAAANLIAQLAEALAPLERLQRRAQPFAEIAAQHRAVVARLAAGADGAMETLNGPDGRALASVFDDIADSAPSAAFDATPGDYGELFAAAIADRVVRRPGLPGVRVRIYGPLEARLQSVDRLILGGLTEGAWPPETRTDPWLSRPMRQQLGLDLPERRISLSAHDFAQAMGAPEIVLTYAAKVAGAPSVTSRFVQRLAAIAGETRWSDAVGRGADYLALARALDAPAKVEPVAAPAPCPPLAARPKRLSVTEIEHWMRDPYSIFAKHVLGLTELDAIDTPPGYADRGSVIHGAVGDFTSDFKNGLPADPLAELIRLGERHFAALEDFPEAKAFWWPRFRRIAQWYVGWETERRADLKSLYAETRGEIGIPRDNPIFHLSGRADRIELRADGAYAILDYKTGAVPSDKQVGAGLSPQLTLEAAMLRGGGFRDIPSGASVAELAYVALKGGAPAGELRSVKFKDSTPDTHADIALAKLTQLVMRFADPAQPYRSLLLSMWATRYGSFDHLARVKEWSATGGGNDAGGGE